MKYFISTLFFSFILPMATMSATFSEHLEEPVIQDELSYPVIILGSGVGAMVSALYLARSGLKPLVIQGTDPGGQIMQSTMVENWPGEILINGKELMGRLQIQAEKQGAIFSPSTAIEINLDNGVHIKLASTVNAKTTSVRANSCIIATGVSPNYLNIPGESGDRGYWGRGVSNCALCDGAFYRDKTVVVIGSGDKAVLEATHLSNTCKHVHLMLRSDHFKAQERIRKDILLSKDNVSVTYNAKIKEIHGDGEQVDYITYEDLNTGKQSLMVVDAVFLATGSKPNSQLFQGHLDLDDKGYILLKNDQETSREGVFAIGDIVDPLYKQAITAAGDGAKAAIQAIDFLERNFQESTFSAIRDDRGKLPFSKKESINPVLPEITKMSELIEILEKTTMPVIVDFYADWCGPCKKLAPFLDTMADQLKNQVYLVKANVDSAMELCRHFNIQSMPTLLIFDKNKSVPGRLSGPAAIRNYFSKLKSLNKPVKGRNN